MTSPYPMFTTAPVSPIILDTYWGDISFSRFVFVFESLNFYGCFSMRLSNWRQLNKFTIEVPKDNLSSHNLNIRHYNTKISNWFSKMLKPNCTTENFLISFCEYLYKITLNTPSNQIIVKFWTLFIFHWNYLVAHF